MRRSLRIVAALVLAMLCVAAWPQPQPRIPVVGVLEADAFALDVAQPAQRGDQARLYRVVAREVGRRRRL